MHRIAICVAVAAALAGAGISCVIPRPDLREMTLLSNEYAFRHPATPDAIGSPDWTVTSGSLYRHGDYLWSGTPDASPPGPSSARGTDSAVLRAVRAGSGYTDVSVRFDLHVNGLTTTARTPARDFDGVHVMLRYTSERSAYFVSVSRRDGLLVIKRKTAGGPSNGGTYRTLAMAPAPLPAPRSVWRHVEATIRGSAAVRVTVRIDGFAALQAVDHTAPGDSVAGQVGLRGDNCDFIIRGFRISPPATLL
ncbi:hypothetical protein ACQP2F_14670 [Actinoplanes sp. CA-030573]|uniref:hypothetical protein n=1 Tax=Actinoplanes sp. CA-030573 TaxID=3239898 RepID=UPI003D93ED0F